MRLINRTLLFLSVTLFVIVSFWAFLFYHQLLTQVKTTVDEGLANYKIVIIDKLKDDKSPTQQDVFLENNYIIKSVSEKNALQIRDTFKDTLIYSTTKNSSYQTRLLTTAFVASNGKYYILKVISQELNKGKLLRKLAFSLFWLYLFLFISTILVNNFVLKKTWKPFYRLLDYLNNFRLDKGVIYKPQKTKIKEFSMLNSSVLNLLRTNVDIFNSQKQFIENASHEMQTPLAIGINKLELLAGDTNLSSDQIQKIGNVIEAFQRLSGLNKSLLLLSKIENKQFISKEKLYFENILSRIINDFSDYIEYQKIKIQYIKESNWQYKMNKDLAEILIMNLIKNAIIHNQPNGEISVKLTSSCFIIENTSTYESITTDKLFERFNKNPNSKNSTGLGLPIAKAIADVSGLIISYSYNERHIFKVSAINNKN